MELDKLRAAAEFILEEHQATPIKVHEELQGEPDSLRATALQRKAAITEAREETSSEVIKMRFKCNSEVALGHELLVLIRPSVDARENRKDKGADTLVKLRKVYEYERKVRVEAHIVKWGELCERVASLRSGFGKSDFGVADHVLPSIKTCASATRVEQDAEGGR